MLPSSHVVPISTAETALLSNPQLLADAFSEFISASTQLEASYRGLQQKVAYLSGELADRNTALTRSLAENDGIRKTLQQMIDSLPCGVLVVDNRESVVFINPEGRRLLGIESIRVKTLPEVSRASCIDFGALSACQSNQRDTELRVSSDCGERWVAVGRRELAGSLNIPEAGSAPLHSIWILRDVTAAHLAEQEREAARRAATLAEISSILAHEIRNPLASLELFIELMATDPGAAPQWIAHLQAGIRTLSGTVNNVLSLNGERNLRFSHLDLVACVQSAVEFVRPVAEQANVALAFLSPGEPLFIDGNEDGIRQIILNLACNAIRHTDREGKVEISIRGAAGSAGRSVVVEVRDTGCGISKEQIGRLFDAGFSGTGETPGLGLAVCQRLMQQHRGAIQVASRLLEGSTFVLEFPEC